MSTDEFTILNRTGRTTAEDGDYKYGFRVVEALPAERFQPCYSCFRAGRVPNQTMFVLLTPPLPIVGDDGSDWDWGINSWAFCHACARDITLTLSVRLNLRLYVSTHVLTTPVNERRDPCPS
jgi:hypothetical protein